MKWCIKTFCDGEEYGNLSDYAEYKLVDFLNKWHIRTWKVVNSNNRGITVAYYIDDNIYPEDELV